MGIRVRVKNEVKLYLIMCNRSCVIGFLSHGRGMVETKGIDLKIRIQKHLHSKKGSITTGP